MAISFDDADEISAIGPTRLLDVNFQAANIGADDFVSDPDLVLEGERAMELSLGLSGVFVVLDEAAAALRDRRVELSVWYRPQGSYPIVELVYLERGGPDLFGDQAAFFAPLGVVRLLPTGRATDDGWIELSTGPLDYRLTGSIQARMLRILDARTWENAIYRSTALQGTSLIDGLEMVDLGPARHDGETECTRGTEATQCGDGACFLGRCVDPKPLLGNAPTVGDVRDDYLARQAFRMQTFGGGRVPESNLDATVAQRLLDLGSETSLVRYWSEFRRAHDDIADGHLAEPSDAIDFVGRGNAACIYQGEIDLLPGGTRIGHLVYRTTTDHPVGARLLPGDALTSIDGLPVSEWVELSSRDLRYPGDPRGRDFIVAPDILNAAIDAGSTLTFERCSRETGPCTEAQVETITIDTAELTASYRGGAEPSWWRAGSACDFRFSLPFSVSGQGDTGSNGVFFSDFRGVRSIVIDGVIGFGRWRRQAIDATTSLPGRIVLDQRTGGGGTFDGVSILTAPFLSTAERPFVQVFPQVEPDLTQDSRLQFLRCAAEGGERNQCGNFFVLPLQGQSNPPSRVPGARVAVVNGRDVSGNDYLARALKDRVNGPTRIFGAVPTYGAFGPIISLPSLMEELRGGSVQLQDTLFVLDGTDRNLDFTTGIGVEPDEIVYQRQSDAVAGRDTLLQAADAWVRGEDQ